MPTFLHPFRWLRGALPALALVVVSSVLAVPPEHIPSSEIVLFVDDFDNNNNNWSNIGPGSNEATIGVDPQMPGVTAWHPSLDNVGASFPGIYSLTRLAAPAQPGQTMVAVYMRARVHTPAPTTGENNKFTIVLAEETGGTNAVAASEKALGQLIVKPSSESTRYSKLGYTATNAAGVLTNQLEANLPVLPVPAATNYADYRLTLTPNDDGTMMTLAAWLWDSTNSVWMQFGSNSPPAIVGSGSFNMLQLIARNAANSTRTNVRAYFDSVAVTFEPASNRPPRIVDLDPANNTLFHQADKGIQFRAMTFEPNVIPPANIRLFLNGTDVSADLTISGVPTNRLVAYPNLVMNRSYDGTIILTDDFGRSTTNRWQFQTFDPQSLVIEAEDYNFGDGNCANPQSPVQPFDGGYFINQPAPGAYSNAYAFVETDLHDLSALKGLPTTNVFRPCDPAGVRLTSDVARPPFTTVGAPDFEVFQILGGEWLNYTRTIPAGSYRIWLRGAAGLTQTVRLDEVTGQRNQPDQTLRPVGAFQLPAGRWAFVPLLDGAGQPVVAQLSGDITLRLTATTALNNLHLNFLVLTPSDDPPAPFIAAASPAAGARDVERHSSVQLRVRDGGAAINPASLRLLINGADVTPGNAVSLLPDGIEVSNVPPLWFSAGATQRVSVEFSDTGTPARSYTNDWAFVTLSRPTLGAIRVNFQTNTTLTPDGYLPDRGEVFGDHGNGFVYGWDQDNTANARERFSTNSPTTALDTFNQFNLPAGQQRRWDIALPDGTYQVFAVAGDPGATNSNFALTAEGAVFLSGVPSTASNWLSGIGSVAVTDGLLTISSQDASGNNKINLVEITPAPPLVLQTAYSAVEGFRLSFTGQQRRPYRVQYKNLLSETNWTDSAVVPGVDGVSTWTDAQAANRPQRFYRVVAE